MTSETFIPARLINRIRQNNCLVKVSVRQCCFKLKAYLPDADGRPRVERYISNVFHRRYGAEIDDFHPLLITIENSENEIIAALGLRFAEYQRLFAEDYSHREIQHLFNDGMKVNGERRSTVEIGNLASSHSGYAKFLFVAMTKILTEWQYNWITFTAVPAVVNIFRKLKLHPVEVCRAHLKDLRMSSSEWGEYYQHGPRVMLGDIASAHRFLEKQGSYQRINFQWA